MGSDPWGRNWSNLLGGAERWPQVQKAVPLREVC